MLENEHFEKIKKICERDKRYQPEAYLFVGEAVLFTAKRLKRSPSGPNRHVSGAELLRGIRDFAIEQYGPMAGEILRNWGLSDSVSIGNVVFNMVGEKLLGAREEDSIEDFKDKLNFEEAFGSPFRPEGNKVETPFIA